MVDPKGTIKEIRKATIKKAAFWVGVAFVACGVTPLLEHWVGRALMWPERCVAVLSGLAFIVLAPALDRWVTPATSAGGTDGSGERAAAGRKPAYWLLGTLAGVGLGVVEVLHVHGSGASSYLGLFLAALLGVILFFVGWRVGEHAGRLESAAGNLQKGVESLTRIESAGGKLESAAGDLQKGVEELMRIESAGGKLENAADDLIKGVEKLQQIGQNLVANVEDATRLILTGFPDIFSRAIRLLDEADRRELWVVNFALEFGRPHLCNAKLTQTYEEKTSRPLDGDVARFWDRLADILVSTENVQILTVTRIGAKRNFLEPLQRRPEYKALDVDKERARFEEKKGSLLTALSETRRTKGVKGKIHLYETPSLPIQIIIAGIRGRDGHPEGRCGCLVFMVGSEVLRAGQKTPLAPTSVDGPVLPLETGFYTELPEVVEIYKTFARSLMRQAREVVRAPDDDQLQSRQKNRGP